MAERLWFSDPVVEGLFRRALKTRLTPSLVAKLRERGLELDKPLQPAYPAERCAEWIRLVAELYPPLSEREATYQVGRANMDGYVQTVLGRAVVQVLKVIGPKRTLPRLGRSFRTGTNYMQVDVREVLPDRFEVTFKRRRRHSALLQGNRRSRLGAHRIATRVGGRK